jgi:formamidopyrimidine-DNA glycosylase
MSHLIVHGGRPLRGRVSPSANKNAVLPVLCATLLTSEPVTLHRVPDITDVRKLLEYFRELGSWIDMDFASGTLRLHDPRRFGAVVFAPGEDHISAQKLLGRLGVEPLSAHFDPAAFHAALKLKKTAIKQVLLGGEAVVGVGNIYASEALFLAGIRPTTRASRISKPRAALLHAAIRQVLAQAVTKGGSTLRDFSNAWGESGYFQLEAMVYDRAGQPCRVCAAPVKSIRQGQRSTFYCATCQKP